MSGVVLWMEGSTDLLCPKHGVWFEEIFLLEKASMTLLLPAKATVTSWLKTEKTLLNLIGPVGFLFPSTL